MSSRDDTAIRKGKQVYRVLGFSFALLFSFFTDIPLFSGELVEGEDFVYVTRDGGAGGYEAFPDVCRLEDGRLLCVFYDGYGHIAWPNASIFKTGGRISGCYSSDEGKTWSSPFVVFDSPFDDRDPSLTVLNDGTILCCFFILDKPVDPKTSYRKLGSWFIRSEDGGASWSEPTPISDRFWGSSPIRILRNGTWIVGLYNQDPDWNAAVGISENQGKRWRVEIVPTAGLPNGDETDLIQRQDGSLYLIVRNREGAGPRPMLFSQSFDGGTTWTEAESTGFSGHSPYLYRTPDDIYVLGTRTGKTPLEGDGVLPGTTTIRLSFDEGKTWGLPITVDCKLGAYPSMVTLTDGSTLIVYYEEGPGSNIRARKFRINEKRLEWLKFDR